VAHDIIIICLPPHTTHKLQPCDVGVFSHVAREWVECARTAYAHGMKITKYDFLTWYTRARNRAITPNNVISAFEDCGIWPYNPNVITSTDLAPAQITTTRAAQPLPAVLPPFLQPTSASNVNTTKPFYDFKNLPPYPGPLAPRTILRDTIIALYTLLNKSLAQMSYDHAQKVLMDVENGLLRQKLYGKDKERARVTHLNTSARVLTSEASINALFEVERKKNMGTLLKQAGPVLKELRSWIDEAEKVPLRRIEEEEEVAIQEHKTEEKILSDKIKQWDAAKALVLKYDHLRIAGKAPKTRLNNEVLFQEQCIKESKLTEDVRAQVQRTSEAEARMRPLQQRRTARLEAAAVAEKIYQDAVAGEKQQQDAIDILAAQKTRKLATLQKRPVDPKAHWKAKISERPEVSNLTKYDQNVPKKAQLEPSMEANASRVDIVELRGSPPPAEGPPSIPVLQIIDQNLNGQVVERVDEPL
jgi:hypothetical protein